jgi:SprT-like family
MRQSQLQRYLSRSAARRVRVRLTDDRRSLLTAEEAPDNMVGVRLHGMFLDAPSRVLKALARFVQTPEPQLKRQVIRLYRETGLDRTGNAAPATRTVTLRHQGVFFDLKELFDRLNEDYFGGKVQVLITWGRRNGRPGRRSVHFGSYNWDRRLIRVNPSLDRCFVPRYFIEYIIYHEMLHADLGFHRDGQGRRSAHSKEFQGREARFRHYERARDWERRNLRHFLRSANIPN